MKKQANKMLILSGIAAALLLIKKKPISGIGGNWSHGIVEDVFPYTTTPGGIRQWRVRIRLDNGYDVYDTITPSNSLVNRKINGRCIGKTGWFNIRLANFWFVLLDVRWDYKNNQI